MVAFICSHGSGRRDDISLVENMSPKVGLNRLVALLIIVTMLFLYQANVLSDAIRHHPISRTC